MPWQGYDSLTGRQLIKSNTAKAFFAVVCTHRIPQQKVLAYRKIRPTLIYVLHCGCNPQHAVFKACFLNNWSTECKISIKTQRFEYNKQVPQKESLLTASEDLLPFIVKMKCKVHKWIGPGVGRQQLLNDGSQLSSTSSLP